MMRVPRITIVFEPTEEQVTEWEGPFAVIAPMKHEEWLDLWKFLAAIDGFVEQVAPLLTAFRDDFTTLQEVQGDTIRRLLALAEDAQGAASLMPAVHYLMNRFAMVAEAKVKKERLQ